MDPVNILAFKVALKVQIEAAARCTTLVDDPDFNDVNIVEMSRSCSAGNNAVREWLVVQFVQAVPVPSFQNFRFVPNLVISSRRGSLPAHEEVLS